MMPAQIMAGGIAVGANAGTQFLDLRDQASRPALADHRPSLILRLKQQTGIAIGVESVAVVDGMGIGRTHRFKAGKGRNQHEQRRARQMEIGHQHVGSPEAVAGVMKMSVGPDQAASVPSGRAALSSSRSEVVPTAMMRPPLACAAFSAAAVAC